MKFSPRSITLARRGLLGVVGLATLLAVFVAIENWRGDRAWAAAEAALERRGAPVTIDDIQRTPAIPPGKNFFEAPVLATLLYVPKSGATERQKLLQDTHVALLGLALAGGKTGTLVELRQQLQNLKLLSRSPSDDPAADIREALKPADAVLDELQRAALERTESHLAFRWPLEETQLRQDFSTLHQVGGALLLRATADLALGRSERAMADIVTVFRLVDGLTRPPSTLLQFLVAQALRAAAAIPLREGLRRHAWSESQLIQLQALWSDYPAIARFRAAFETEQAWAITYNITMRDRRLFQFRSWFLFHGWIQQNKAAYVRFMEQSFLPVLDPAAGRILPERLEEAKQAERAWEESHSPYIGLAQQAAEDFTRLVSHFASSENSVRLAATAIALERHRIAHRAYPDSLAALAPSFVPEIPVNVLTGKASDYTRQPEGGFTLALGPSADARSTWTQED